MFEYILQEPLWLQSWVFWMIGVNLLCVAFLRHTEARWVLAAWIGNLILMTAIFELNGYNRLLGLSHVVWWTPLLVYLFRQRQSVPSTGAFAAWVRVLFLTNGASLLIDYIDVVRYALGDRA
jgi:hypothetical protein